MNQALRTYGVVINLDYSHKSLHECKFIWNKIVHNMLQENFHMDKRMFMMTTCQGIKTISDKARSALNSLDDEIESYNKHSFQYISDFFITDMSDYVDLRFPAPDMGIEFKEHSFNKTYRDTINNPG